MAEWGQFNFNSKLSELLRVPTRGACGEEPGTEKHEQVRS